MGQLAVVLPLALLVGVALGALGGGGAIMTVPILVYLVGQPTRSATAGSLIIVALTSAVGMVSHLRKGNVRVRDGLVFGAVGVLGSLLGTWLSSSVPAAVLMTAFGVLMIGVAVLMFRGRRSDGDGERRGLLPLALAASGVGFLTGFFGVGGGFAVVPALVLVLGFPMPVAVGTSLLVIIVNSVVALGGRIAGGIDVDWAVILPFSLVAAAGALLGGRIAAKADPATLKKAFGVLLLCVAAYVLTKNVPELV